MSATRARTVLVFTLAAQLMLGGYVTAQAGVITTQSAIDQQLRSQRIDRVSALLAAEQVRQRLVEYGVDPEFAEARLSGLTDQELALLEQRLDELPAGAGVLEVVGIVFVVLLILELVGVIDIFKAT